MASFSPSTAYANDWQWVDDVQDGIYFAATEYGVDTEGATVECKVKINNATSQDYREFSRGLGLAPDANILAIWFPYADGVEKISQGDRVTVGETEWIISATAACERFGGFFVCGAGLLVSND